VRAGVATLHGPAVAGEVFLKDEATARGCGARSSHRRPSAPWPRRRPAAGAGAGPRVTLGGCLAMLAAELGTPHARRGAAGGLLLLEDVGEPPYRIDRALTQLLRGGWLEAWPGSSSVWARCGPYERVREVLTDRLGGLGVPVVEEFGFGHGDSAVTLPLVSARSWTRRPAP